MNTMSSYTAFVHSSSLMTLHRSPSFLPSGFARHSSFQPSSLRTAQRAFTSNRLSTITPITMGGGVPKVPYKAPGAQNYEFIDVFERLNRDRILFIGQDIDDDVANQLIATLLFLEQTDDSAPVSMYLNSPGGSYHAALAVYDCMMAMKYPITTLNLGFAGSMAAFLCAAGTKGKRLALPNARFMIQAPSLYEAKKGQASDIQIEVTNILKQKQKMVQKLSDFTGRPVETINTDLKRDLYLTAFEAREYGLIDQVVTPKLQGGIDYNANVGLGTPTVKPKKDYRTGIF